MPGMTEMPDTHSDMMNTYFIAALPNVPLWVAGWIPVTAAAAFGACFGLFVLALFTRFLGAVRHQVNLAWAVKHGQKHPDTRDNPETGPEAVQEEGAPNDRAVSTIRGRKLPPAIPWRAQREFPRAGLATLHATLEFFLMLAVMTYNVYYFISIIMGIFTGELIFGRWASVHLTGRHA